MKHLRLLIYALAAMLSVTACNDDENESTGTIDSSQEVLNKLKTGDYGSNDNSNDLSNEVYGRLEMPRINPDKSDNLVIAHRAVMDYSKNKTDINYCVEWNIYLKSPRWVCYVMNGTNRETNTSRYNADTSKGEVQYPQDDLLPVEYQFPEDPFWGTGYDHGHICPSADRLCSKEANIQTFNLTNMMPMANGFNAGVWSNMESTLRNWVTAGSDDIMFVAKGGTIEDNAVTTDAVIKITDKGLLVPKYYWMAVLKLSRGGFSAMGFWVEHTNNGDARLLKYAISIDELERRTGLDFFCNLPDKIEDRVESTFIPDFWGLR